MKAITGITNTIYFGFFSSHIVATVLIDSQAILPQFLIPQSLQNVLSWYVNLFDDPLMGGVKSNKNLLWFQSLIWLEFIIQLPFFFYACYMLQCTQTKYSNKGYPSTFRYACIAYGGHAATSMVPILATLCTNQQASVHQRAAIVSVYLPYLLFPLGLMWLAMDENKPSSGTKKNE